MAERMEFGWKVPEFPAGRERQCGDDPADDGDARSGRGSVRRGVGDGSCAARGRAGRRSRRRSSSAGRRSPSSPRATRNLTWGTIVLCQSNRNPALLAKMVANLCAFIPGKFIFGIGAGWKEDEYRAYNWEFPKPAVRIAQLEETVEIAKRLWTRRQCDLRGAVLPRPQRLPQSEAGPPAADHDRRQRRAVDAPGRRQARRLVERRRHAGDLRAQAGRAARPLRGGRARFRRRSRRRGSASASPSRDTQAEAERMAAASPFYAAPESALVGTPEQVVAQIRAWAALGVSQMQIRFADFPKTDGIRLFMDEVMPQFVS